MNTKFENQEIYIIDGELKGSKGILKGIKQIINAGDMLCKIEVNNSIKEITNKIFRFTNPDLQNEWENGEVEVEKEILDEK